MISSKLSIEILSYWHVSSGHGRGGDVDAMTLRDASGFPYLPGKAIKGLIREAVQMSADNGVVNKGIVSKYFGEEGDHKAGGGLIFDNASLPEFERQYMLRHKELIDGLFESISATKIDPETGTADSKSKSLRTREVVIPLTLESVIYGPDSGEWVKTLNKILPLVRMLGVNRHRGLGRCSMTLLPREKSNG
ncbi:hypothetical protein K8T06_03650 [bacterium]|nr:hypothetical protein [bacterium]